MVFHRVFDMPKNFTWISHAFHIVFTGLLPVVIVEKICLALLVYIAEACFWVLWSCNVAYI